MADKTAEPIQYILKSELGGILSKGFAELYRKKPNFPVTYLANWLKDYSKTQNNKKQKVQNVKKNIEQFNKLQQQSKKKSIQIQQEKQKKFEKLALIQNQFKEKIESTQYLQDLLIKWFPTYIEKRYNLSGAYVGYLTHVHKPIQPGNFEPGAEFDPQSAKVIEYIGASESQQKTMHMKILPSQTGISFQCFIQPQPQPEEAQPVQGQQPKPPKPPRKTYLFVPDVTKNEKIYFFKFGKLGSYVCFPMKIKSVLIQSGFQAAVNQYKQFLKRKQETEKEYHDRVNQLKAQYEQAKKKYEQFQIPEEQPSQQQLEEKKALEEQASKTHKALQQFQAIPPKIEQPNFGSVEKCYLLGCDTLGQDKVISEEVLNQIDQKTKYFKNKYQQKQKKMLLNDILSFIQQQPKLDPVEALYKQHQKNALAQVEQTAKEKNIKDKQLEYEISAGKAKKMDAIFEQPLVEKSMRNYFSYHTAKYKQIIQIALMLLGYNLNDINLSRKNTIDFRKISQPKFIQAFLKKLSQFDLRPQSAQACANQYKINKLLQRLQKIDLQQVLRYNGFLWVLANHIKSYCWALILCRDSRKQAYQLSIKSSQDRNAEIQKYKQQRQKAMEAAKTQLGEENQANFNEQEWINNYIVQNPQPQPIQPIKLQEYLNID